MPYLSLESVNFPNMYIRHRNFLGELTTIQNDLDRKDATFYWMNPLNYGIEGRLESLNFPKYYLRHQNFRIRLDYYNPPLTPPGALNPQETPEQKLMREDSTFILVPGLSDPRNPNLYSFRSKNFPDRYIRHRDFHLYLEPADSELAKKDATFYMRGPLAQTPPEPILRGTYCPLVRSCPWNQSCPWIKR